MLNDTTNFADYKIERIRLVDNKFSAFPEPDKDIDTKTSDRIAADYARKNLSSDNAAAPLKDAANETYTYTLVDNFSRNRSEITMTPYLCQDGDIFYYVVRLTENVRHFFMPGGYDAMSAPVVAVAMLAKTAEAAPLFKARTLILDANGGTLLDEESQSGTRRKVAENEEAATLLPTKATIKLKNYNATFNEELLFIGWNTKADGSGTTYGDGKSFTPSELNQLFGTRDTVVLYAQWERRNIYIAGDSLYNAMKGNASYKTKGLEELMTYNTWVAINKLGKSETYGVYPDGGASVYNSKGDLFRTETTEITVRQIFINVNVDNTKVTTATGTERYWTGRKWATREVTETVTPRPMIIFYEGPDRGLTEGVDDSDKNSSQSGSPKKAYPNLSWRDSKPVILNLNADFRGILFAPNSPVVINGNGKNFYGFVIAREFVRVTTASDYTAKDGKYFDSNGKEWFQSSQTNNGITNTVFVDAYGNVDTRPLFGYFLKVTALTVPPLLKRPPQGKILEAIFLSLEFRF